MRIGKKLNEGLLIVLTMFVTAMGLSSMAVAKDSQGTLRLRLQSWPQTLNQIKIQDAAMAPVWVVSNVRMILNAQEDYRPVPMLAASWETSADFKTLTYNLNPKAAWHDGSPITAEDVVFTLETLYDIKSCALCEGLRSWAGSMKSAKAEGKHKVVVEMNNQHFDNVMRIGWVPIYQKSKFSKGKLDGKKYDRIIVGGGPYKYDKAASKFRKTIVLKKVKDHWLDDQEYFKTRNNFDKIIFKHIKDDVVAFESFKRGDLDALYFRQGMYSYWDNDKAAPFDNPNVVKATAHRYYPSAWGGVALNMRKGPLADKNFRKAMQHLLNREVFMKKLFNNHQRAVAGPFFQGSDYSANLDPIPFSPEKARELLKAAGFDGKADKGVLYRMVDKDGKKVKEYAEFDLMYATNAHDRWITMYKEQAKEVGVKINPRLSEWSAATKQLDEFKFDAFVIGWSGDVVPGPRQLFYGKSANNKGTSNYPGLNDTAIDALIDKGPATVDEKERYKLYQELERRIVDAQPYLFRWIPKEHMVSLWKDKVNPGEKPFFKFSGTDTSPMPYWSHWKVNTSKLSKK